MYHVSQLPQLLPVVFVQPQTQTWIKEADEKNAKMQDICNKETKTTAASLTLFEKFNSQDYCASHVNVLSQKRAKQKKKKM